MYIYTGVFCYFKYEKYIGGIVCAYLEIGVRMTEGFGKRRNTVHKNTKKGTVCSDSFLWFSSENKNKICKVCAQYSHGMV